MKPKLIIILGPTASGKSDLAVSLARQFDGEIINADSRQLYYDMIIGTASPFHIRDTKYETRNKTVHGIPHHLFHFVKPDAYFSVAEYKKRAVAVINEIAGREKMPFLVGGTGLYIWTVVDNLMIPEVPPDAPLRAQFQSQETALLFEQLKTADPEAVHLTGRNKRRIIRALEVIAATGKKFTDLRKPGEQIFDTLQIGLSVPMDELDKRIETRAQKMLANGFIEEVQNLLKKYPPELSAFDSPGYRECIRHLQGKLTLTEATEQFIRAHKRLARRQVKWLKRDPRIQWFPPEERIRIKEIIQSFLG